MSLRQCRVRALDNISLHLKNIFREGELKKDSVTEDFSVVQKEGQRSVRRKVTFYNLDAIISVGYRVNSIQATKFRIWATKVLKEYMQKGFVLDDNRLKQGSEVFGKDYFRELIERVKLYCSTPRIKEFLQMGFCKNPEETIENNNLTSGKSFVVKCYVKYNRNIKE